MKLKGRKLVLHQIYVMFWGNTYLPILVTLAQLAKLNKLEAGAEVFLNNHYCHSLGNCWVIRIRDGLQYMPNPHRTDNCDSQLLETLLK